MAVEVATPRKFVGRVFKEKEKFVAKRIAEVLGNKTAKQVKDKRREASYRRRVAAFRCICGDPRNCKCNSAYLGNAMDSPMVRELRRRPVRRLSGLNGESSKSRGEAHLGEGGVGGRWWSESSVAREKGDRDATWNSIDEMQLSELVARLAAESTYWDKVLAGLVVSLPLQGSLDSFYEEVLPLFVSKPSGDDNGPAKCKNAHKIKKYRYARTQDLYKNDLGLLAKCVRKWTMSPRTWKLDRILRGTKPVVRLAEPRLIQDPIQLSDFIWPITVEELKARANKINKSSVPEPDRVKPGALVEKGANTLLAGLFNLALFRLFWGLFDQRLRKVVKLNPRQKGFKDERGCFNNVRLLVEVVRLMKTVSGGAVGCVESVRHDTPQGHWACTEEVRSAFGNDLPSVKAGEILKYLGIGFSLWSGIDVQAMRTSLSSVLKRVERATLKPYQKLKMLNTYIIPHYMYQLVVAMPSRNVLVDMTDTIRNCIKNVMHLPRSINDGIINCGNKNGSLGCQRLEELVPRVALGAGLKFIDSEDPMVAAINGRMVMKAELRRMAQNARVTRQSQANNVIEVVYCRELAENWQHSDTIPPISPPHNYVFVHVKELIKGDSFPNEIVSLQVLPALLDLWQHIFFFNLSGHGAGTLIGLANLVNKFGVLSLGAACNDVTEEWACVDEKFIKRKCKVYAHQVPKSDPTKGKPRPSTMKPIVLPPYGGPETMCNCEGEKKLEQKISGRHFTIYTFATEQEVGRDCMQFYTPTRRYLRLKQPVAWHLGHLGGRPGQISCGLEHPVVVRDLGHQQQEQGHLACYDVVDVVCPHSLCHTYQVLVQLSHSTSSTSSTYFLLVNNHILIICAVLQSQWSLFRPRYILLFTLRSNVLDRIVSKLLVEKLRQPGPDWNRLNWPERFLRTLLSVFQFDLVGHTEQIWGPQAAHGLNMPISDHTTPVRTAQAQTNSRESIHLHFCGAAQRSVATCSQISWISGVSVSEKKFFVAAGARTRRALLFHDSHNTTCGSAVHAHHFDPSFTFDVVRCGKSSHLIEIRWEVEYCNRELVRDLVVCGPFTRHRVSREFLLLLRILGDSSSA
uniref:Uncharacterized protein n=1 Tax=Timema genevievae TaxID=629358 RepID=A0A7R9PL20_TIMGE|nr:unnamed protein product [Timema genevievae]